MMSNETAPWSGKAALIPVCRTDGAAAGAGELIFFTSPCGTACEGLWLFTSS